MRVTIISDASVCPKQHVGGYGFWAVSNRGAHAGEGVFRGTVLHSQEAEMKAIVNALHCALSAGVAAAGDSVLIQSDSTNAIACFERRSRISKIAAPIVEALELLRAQHTLRIEFRHVKGHSKTFGAKFSAQRRSDQRARRAMKKARRSGSTPPKGGPA